MKFKEAWSVCKKCKHVLFFMNGVWKHCVPIVWSVKCSDLHKKCKCVTPIPIESKIRIQKK